MKRLRSFTIIELTISLLIGGIVIGIAYYVFFLFISQYKTREIKSNLIQESLLLRKAIQADIDRYNFITDSSSFLIFRSVNFPSIVQYNLQGNFIIRSSSSSSNDTFYIKKRGYKFYHLKDDSNLVNKMDISLNADKENVDITFDKLYSSEELLMFPGFNE